MNYAVELHRPNAGPLFQAGDIAACYGTEWTSRVIRAATASPFAPRGLRVGPSHVAVLFQHPQRGLLWGESTSLCRRPCWINAGKTAGAQAHRIGDRIDDYLAAGGRVDLYRPSPLWALTVAEAEKLAGVIGRALDLRLHYDTAGALLSGTRLLKFSRLIAADLDALFCSELVAQALQTIGRLAPENPGRFSPTYLLRRLVRTGVYERLRTFASVPSDPAVRPASRWTPSRLRAAA